jgi:hypothetical protein
LKDAIAVAANDEIEELIGRIFGFYGLQSSNLSVVLLPRPDGIASYKGSQRGDLAIVELGTDDSAAAKIGVVLHELSHHLLHQATVFNARRYQSAQACNVPGIGVAIGLSDEVLATAIGNGVAQKHLRSETEFFKYRERPNSFYDHEAIDRAAKATLPIVEKALAAGALPDSTFFDHFHSAIIQSLGDSIYLPSVALQTSNFLYTDKSVEPVALAVWRDLSLSSLYTNYWVPDKVEAYIVSRYPQISAVLWASPVEIRSIAAKLGGYPKVESPLREPCVVVNSSGGLAFLVPLIEGEPKLFPKAFPRCR